MAEILIVDDDPQLRQSFEKLLSAEGHMVRAAASGEAGLALVRERAPEAVVMDIRMPGMTGLETFAAMRRVEPKLPVIVMTAFGTTETAIEATKMGAFDYVLKPFEIPAILKLIDQAVEAGRIARGRVELDPAPDSLAPEALVGRSRAMHEVYKAIGRTAPTDALVLIRGESGTGKELVARALFQHSLRADKPFVVINCVAIPETLLESELFGYERGAFTGAVNRRIGKIEQASGGTVFLDEIGDMPLPIQAKILRLLAEKKIERLGGREPIPVDVRILAATNRDLERALELGRFREDLYYRLKVVTIALPPLSERREDIPLLAEHFLARFAREMDMQNPGLTAQGKEFLAAQPWPGNVRELANALQKALIFSRGVALDQDELAQVPGRPAAEANGDPLEREAAPFRDLVRGVLAAHAGENAFEALMDLAGRVTIREALEITGGNRSRAARLLGLSRPTLLAKIEKYGLKIKTSVS